MRIDLAGTWRLTRVQTKETLPAQVPGDTHSALLAAGTIPDPYVAMNELDVQWVGREDWVYGREFTVDKAFLAATSVYLNCDGLDTMAEIRINGRRVGATANMFVRCRLEVKPFLKAGRNAIEIRLHSAEAEAVAQAEKMPYPIPFGSNPVQSPHRNLVRKVQCHSGWDWGPCLMVAGIYGDISLTATDAGRIEYVYCDQQHVGTRCIVTVHCEFLAAAAGRTTLAVELAGQRVVQAVSLTSGLNQLAASVTVANPQLWWPNGHGAQPLYPLTVTVGDATITKKLGFRTLELITEEDKGGGLSMVFRVNGRDLFCKGADWIPCDALPQRQTRQALDDLLTSAAQAHMNMLRVWGGGQYESTDFYELCDEKGLLIWQDFMFACALYPATPDFLELCRQEAVHQVKRLRDHACLALWCGNNEDIGAMNWFKEARENRDRYLVDYDRLNEGILGNVTRALDPARVFWPSSPCGGPGDYSDCWHKDNRGDMHYWEVWHGGKSFDAYFKVTPRFCSEFGYQSFPSLDAIRTYADEDQFNVTAPVMEHHQRNHGGNSKIIEMFSRYFRMPEGFDNFVYLSQVQQGLAIKTGVEHWRHLRPTCMGTIYWQLNDNWPVCSWASLEYGGKWKLLHYMAKRFYAPTIVSAFQRDDGTVEVWLTDDSAEAQPAVVTLQVRDFTGKPLKTETFNVRTPGGGARLLKAYPLSRLTGAPHTAFLLLSLEVGGAVTRNEHFFAVPKKCDLPCANVGVRAKLAAGGFAVSVSSDAPAFYVSLNADGIRGEFDDNAFTLLPGETRTLHFTPKQEGVRLAAFRRALSFKHLRLTYR